MNDHNDDWIFDITGLEDAIMRDIDMIDDRIQHERDAERYAYESADRAANVNAITQHAGRKRQSVVWRWLIAIGEKKAS